MKYPSHNIEVLYILYDTVFAMEELPSFKGIMQYQLDHKVMLNYISFVLHGNMAWCNFFVGISQ